MAAQLLVVGRGRVGRSLARAFAKAGHAARLLPARGSTLRLVRALESHPRTIVFIAVPDDSLAGFANTLAAGTSAVPASVGFVHVSGALGLDALGRLSRRHPVGSFHPLRSFPVPQPPEALRGIVIAINSSSLALSGRLRRLARDLGARPRMVADRDRILYHAAAVLASNYGVALMKQAAGLLEAIGWTEPEAIAGLLPLMTGALDQVAKRGPAAALTGPIRRGDVATVERHLGALERLPRNATSGHPAPSEVYRMLGAIALEIAKDAGLEPAAAERMRRALTRRVAATRRRRRR